MAKIVPSLILTYFLISLSNAGHCIDEKNDFQITDIEIFESKSLNTQAYISISGFFKQAQFINFVTLDYTLDGSNWQRSHSKVLENFQADEFSSFLINISVDGEVSEQAQAVFSVVEDVETVWCEFIQISSKYHSRKLMD